MLGQVVPGPDGRAPRRAARRHRAARRGRADRRGSGCRPATQVLSEVGGRAAYPGAAAEYYERNGADASLDVNQIVGGEPRTLVPAVARAHVSLRLAPGQRAAEIGPELERLLRDGARPRRRRQLRLAPRRARRCSSPTCRRSCSPRGRSSAPPARAPALVRSGGSIPVVAEFAARGDPDHRERLRAARRRHPRAQRVATASRACELGSRTARELLASRSPICSADLRRAGGRR